MKDNHLNPEYLRTYARTGFIESVTAFPPKDRLGKGWMISVELRDGSEFQLMHSRETSTPRHFRSLEAVSSAMRRAGISAWKVKQTAVNSAANGADSDVH